MDSFSELPSAGMWKGRPQLPLEAQEELDKIEGVLSSMRGYEYFNESEYSYCCVDAKEG